MSFSIVNDAILRMNGTTCIEKGYNKMHQEGGANRIDNKEY